ncbi:MAG: beta-glucosidase [Candidatus Cryptobacteroides sp.]
MKPKLSLILMSAVPLAAGCLRTPVLNEDNIDKVVSSMSLEEKAALVVGTAMDSGMEGFASVVGSSADDVAGGAGGTHAIPRLGIPRTTLADGPAGLRIDPVRPGDDNTYYCTHFPIGTLLASTWDQALVERVGEAMGNEVLEYGCDVLLAPAENIHRNPLTGRNFEYFSEDPVLSGKTAAAYVRGVQKNGVGTSVKHFAFNNQETNRTGNNALISARAQREIYLKGFEITVRESSPWTVMTSYNKSNGIYTSENEELLQKVLREDWGYDGIVMTDWYGGKDAVEQMHAGNDLLMPGRPSQYEAIIEGIKDGSLDMDDLDRNVRRILEFVVKTPHFKNYKFSNKPDLQAHAQVTRQSATEGMVLLENKQALPLYGVSSAALFGVTSYDFIAGGTGSGNVNRAYTVSLLDGLNNVGVTVDENLAAKYRKYRTDFDAEVQAKRDALDDGMKAMTSILPPELPDEMLLSDSELAKAAKDNDIAIITLGRISGEMLDRTYDNFNLSANERALVNSVCRVFHNAGKKCIVVLNVGGAIETASWKNLPDAILLAWQAGQEGGNSVADVLVGNANPSGKLPMTWPVSVLDHASTKNFPKAENFGIDWSTFLGIDPAENDPVETYDWTDYAEGIYVGYRWFDKQSLEVSYPFGYGLSYTSFEYGSPSVENDGRNITVKVEVRNNGNVPGKEVVQLYASAPGKDMDKPLQELKAFAKTALLEPGKSEIVTMVVPVTDLASFNEEFSSWIVEAGTYHFLIGASSRDIRCKLGAEVKGKSWRVNNVLARQNTDPRIKVVKTKKNEEPGKTDLASFADFMGEWDCKVTGIPTGDVSLTLKVEPEGETAGVTLTAFGVVTVKVRNPMVKGGRLIFNYNYSDMDIPLNISKVAENELKGLMMNSFKMTGKRK